MTACEAQPRIDVRIFNLDHVADDDDTLTSDERRRAERLLDRRDRGRFVARRLALRALLADVTGCRSEDVRYTVGPNGKPRMVGGPHFSLSHTGDTCAVAISSAGPVGVDVERVLPRSTDRLVAQRFYYLEEARALSRLGTSQRTAAFYELWTAKEALAKAAGTGLMEPLPFVGVPVTSGRRGSWWVYPLAVGDGLACTVAAAVPGTVVLAAHTRAGMGR